MRPVRVAVVATMLLLAAACSSATVGSSDGPSVEPTPTVTASPTDVPATEPVPRARAAVFVGSDGDGPLVMLYDADADSVRRLARGTAPRWIDDDRISYVSDGSSHRRSEIWVYDLRTSERERLMVVEVGLSAYDWHPDGERIAYLGLDHSPASSGDGVVSLFYADAGGEAEPRLIATLGRAEGRGGSVGDQVDVAYSPDGAYVLAAYTGVEGWLSGEIRAPEDQSPLQVRDARGRLAFAPPANDQPSQAVWSSDPMALYWVADGGVRRWVPAEDRTEGAGLARWLRPSGSAGGPTIAYDAGRYPDTGIRVLDTSTGATVRVPGRFATPVPSGPDRLWIQRYRDCGPGDDCYEPQVLTGEVFEYDIAAGTRRRLALRSTSLIDVRYV